MGKITAENRNRIIAKYFLGLQRDETATACDAGAGSISKIWRELEETIGPEGKRLREMAVQLRKDGQHIPQAIQGSKIARNLLELGVDPDRIEEFTNGLLKKSLERGRSPEAIAEAASKMIDIEEESKLSYESIPLKGKEEFDKLTRTRQELAEIKNLITDARKEHQSFLSEKETSKENLEEYVRVREGLKQFGIDIDSEAEKSANIFSNLKEQDYDIESLLREAGRHRSLAKEDRDLVKSIETHLAEDKGYQERIEKNKEILSELDMVKRLGFKANFLKEIRQALLKIGSSRNLSPSQTYEKFFNDLQEYDEELGFWYQTDKAKAELETVQSKLKLEKSRLDELDRKSAETREVFNAVKSLMKKGVRQESLVSWEEALAREGVTVEDLNSDIGKYGGLSGAITHLENKSLKLEAEEKSWKAGIEALKEEESNLQQSIKVREEVFVSGMKRIERDALKRAENVISEINSMKEAGVSTLNRVGDEAISRVDALSDVENRMTEDMRIYEKEIGKLEAFKPILDLLIGDGTVASLKLGSVMLFVLIKYRAHLEANGDYDTEFIRSNLGTLISSIEGRIGKFGN